MNTLRRTASAPLFVFGIAVIAFVGWVVFSTAPTRATDDPGSPSATDRTPVPPGPEAVAQLDGLNPGPPRFAVEQQLAPLGRPEVTPVEVSGGKPVFRLRYHLHLEQPLANVPTRGPFVPGPQVLTVECDGSKAEHPITGFTLTSDPDKRIRVSGRQVSAAVGSGTSSLAAR